MVLFDFDNYGDQDILNRLNLLDEDACRVRKDRGEGGTDA